MDGIKTVADGDGDSVFPGIPWFMSQRYQDSCSLLLSSPNQAAKRGQSPPPCPTQLMISGPPTFRSSATAVLLFSSFDIVINFQGASDRQKILYIILLIIGTYD
jgi:hypothetical protein